ncbi:histidine--tRNA ligase [Garciella nitratireducens]|uniref:Histidine--tRNA ligase n=1 Tax=Garciella nitratireducens DSM 15102 TaxID=1121911 RepID=A0A1T4K113_9FIRM|nr:histidine--tRNA ligase [Garciella nitratireducens]RBP39214.1 histidyl-tRNA synthetase [Garciella nitratireducens]SJZ36068.1 histidyl-tRNA synthetase [Garciella nitratireducens DSM 15102]
MLTKAPRGTRDILPSQIYKWYFIENTIRELCERFGYKEIRTPEFEHTELFERGIGDSTDVVQKEMYSFQDKGGRNITLKPEGTSPTVRAFVEHKLYAEAQPTKLFYITPAFRYERPQAGRLRIHHQFGIEVFGSQHPSVDAEVISVAMALYEKLGIKNLELHINSVGCPKCRIKYNKVLKEYLSSKLPKLCSTCKNRYERNPMRILDCKMENCQEELKDAPLMIDYLCEECLEHFQSVQNYLKRLNLHFVIDPKIVRGLDYYTKTAFEIITKEIGAQGTVCGGGRYDGLVEEIGGPSTPGIGFGMGLERLLLSLENKNISIKEPKGFDLFIATLGTKADEIAFKLIYSLRKSGIKVEKDFMNRSLKAQLKYANKINAKYVVIIGEEEIKKDRVILKNMDTGKQEKSNLSIIQETLLNMFK